MVKIKEKEKYDGLIATSAGVGLYSDFATHVIFLNKLINGGYIVISGVIFLLFIRIRHFFG